MKLVFLQRDFTLFAPVLNEEIKEKLFSAEKTTGKLRLLIVALNSSTYFFLFDKSNSIPWLSISLISLSISYSVYVVLAKPYVKFPVLLRSYFTSGTDALLITMWLYATGKANSPFYPLWYASILAIALRYTPQTTIRVTILYSVLYLGLVFSDPAAFDLLPEILVRTGNIGIIGVLSAFLSQETLEQLEARIKLKKSEERIRKREIELTEVRDRLEERVKERTLELNESNKNLLRINDDLDNFIYAASHDLKSPIANIEALFSILFENESNKSKDDLLLKEKISISLDRLKATISHLSEVAKSEKEVYDDMEEIRFDEIVSEVIRENEEVIKSVHASILFDFNQVPSIFYSRTCLKSILYNFITNAVKYRSEDRLAEIFIKTERLNSGVRLSVKDNGLGIDIHRNKDKLFKIFKRFHDHVEGVGIGLYMVKRIIEKNNGRIEVRSEVGKGTVFTVYFQE